MSSVLDSSSGNSDQLVVPLFLLLLHIPVLVVLECPISACLRRCYSNMINFNSTFMSLSHIQHSQSYHTSILLSSRIR